MGEHTKIEWADSTYNPVVGCDGCELHQSGRAYFPKGSNWAREGDPEGHCYAARLVGRHVGLARMAGII